MNMKIGIGVLWFACAGLLPAAEPVRLAIVAEDTLLSQPLDLLTAEFSTNSQLALLERAQIDKVLSEQGLSAANGRDSLRLGQMLGADGLLLLETVSEGTNHFLASRLLAVKPGVVIDAARISWPAKDLMQWSAWMARRLNPLLPKLGVLQKDAIPISVVNLRSALRSREAEELERQLTLLTIERLSRERQVFVLERRQMQMLSAEKELKGLDESAFWNGSYLLEGIVDRDGFVRETVTLSARLAPPKRGLPVIIEVSGSRTNLSEVVNRLAARVTEGLKLGARDTPWNPDEEANQFFEEAKWALRWKITREAQAAAESAWALGKHNMDCALVRVQSYVSELVPEIQWYGSGMPLQPGMYLRGRHYLSKSDPDLATVMRDIRSDYTNAAGIAFDRRWNCLDYLVVNKMPDPKALDDAERVLRLYYEFSQTLPAGEPKADSPWNRLGNEALVSASLALQHYYLVPEAQKPVADRLAELRALARSVAAWIAGSPSVRGSYWVGDRIATHDELAHSVSEGLNIFRCKVDFGCFWEDKPEDCVALYRELMTSAVFAYIHGALWQRPPESPRLTAWDRQDKARLPELWNWEIGDLLREMSGGMVKPTAQKLEQRFSSEFQPWLKELDREYWNKTVPRRQNLARFEQQKQYLTNNSPYDFAKFSQLFRFDQTTPSQAAELGPLLSAYKSNLIAQIESKTGAEKARIQSATHFVGFVETQMARILAAPPSSAKLETPVPTTRGTAPATGQPPRPKTPQPIPELDSTNLLWVRKFFKIPTERLKAKGRFEPQVFLHRWREGKLWLGLHYGDDMGRGADADTAAAAWDPHNGEWEIVPGPVDRVAGDFELFNGALYWISGWWEQKGNEPHSGDAASPDSADRRHARPLKPGVYELAHELQKYDLKTRHWETLPFPGQALARLVTVNGRLFATSDESILEILDGGKGARILASCRRRPAVSVLDSLQNLGSPTLFAGANNSLWGLVGSKVYSWEGDNWSTVLDLQYGAVADAHQDGIVFRADHQNQAQLWLLPRGQTNAQLCLDEASGPVMRSMNFGQRNVPLPKWKKTDTLSLTRGAVEVSGTNLYMFLAYNREAQTSDERWTLEERNGRHANLVLLDHEFPKPLVVPVKFNLAQGPFTDRGGTGASARFIGGGPLWWITLTPESLVIGKANVPGLWMIPRSEIDAFIGQERHRRSEEDLQRIAAVETRRNALLTKYDHNHNGVFDQEEKDEAIDDPTFIELELETIDTDQNGRLDAGELGYFDINKNGLLEPKEQAGIEAAQRLLAARFVRDFDTNGDGRLDRAEFGAAVQNVQSASVAPGMNLSYFDMNHDGTLDPEELSLFLMQQTRRGLLAPGSPPMIAGRGGPNGAVRGEWRFSFKSELEAYWKRQGASKNETAPAGKSSGAAAVRPGTNQTPARQ